MNEWCCILGKEFLEKPHTASKYYVNAGERIGWRFDVQGGQVGIPVDYCPFCGEKLVDKEVPLLPTDLGDALMREDWRDGLDETETQD